MTSESQLTILRSNATNVDFPHELLLHELFEAEAERTPDSVAIVFEDEQLTYRELLIGVNYFFPPTTIIFPVGLVNGRQSVTERERIRLADEPERSYRLRAYQLAVAITSLVFDF
jgi:hypothetical protein